MKVANLRPVFRRLWALTERPLTRAAFDAHCARWSWARDVFYGLLPDEFRVRIGRGLLLQGSFAPDGSGWHAEVAVVWDRRWSTSKCQSKRLFFTYGMTHQDFDVAFERVLKAGIAALGAPNGAGTRRPRHNYSWPTRHHAFWTRAGQVLLVCQSEDPAAGGRSVLLWVGSRSLLRRKAYLPHRLKASRGER
jgi:hypothetical protein